MTGTDDHGQPLIFQYHWSNNEKKAVNTLYGLCMGIVSDGVVDEKEILFLDTWLKDNEQYVDKYPLSVVSARIAHILDDGEITKEEREDLYSVLSQLIGGSPDETGAAGGMSTTYPVDTTGDVDFNGAVFCFTGKFIFGTRSHCQNTVIKLGATAINNVTSKLNYLVIGGLASRDWVASSHGRKIEKAMGLKEKGNDISILSEEVWVNSMAV